VLVGGGRVAAAKLAQLVAARADVLVVASEICPEILSARVPRRRKPFEADDLIGAWLVVAAATPEVNRVVAEAAEARQIFVNAVDDPANASAFMGGLVRRHPVTIAISTGGEAPALAGLLREALDAVMSDDVAVWAAEARRQRMVWRQNGVAMERRRPLLLEALNRLYESP
jgi:uroporphyrin-III C-methyltransferase / precorrin-2 dehydrogenase / sirohydrochlorin ferrochelatase